MGIKGVLPLGLKGLWHEAENSSLFITEIKNEWSYPKLLLYDSTVFIEKNSLPFTFTFNLASLHILG
jgi:hypothetical protein